ncbi:hypothetical protein [Sanyastnella coralliicola]|uniref:hypothetical protein n=1 Tax=Sanyastnella coralliicola TaxID=3069118 RepID=UPI0027B8A472|nr:hypothetical protein [Longitalea sp. SCSIO 12813]
MKKLTLILFALGFLFSAQAQNDKTLEAMLNRPEMKVEQRQMKWQKKSYDAHTMLIHADKGEVEKALVKFFEDKYKISFSKLKGMQAAEGVVMSDIIAETVVVAVSVEEESNGSRAQVIVDLGGSSLNGSDHPTASSNLDRLMQTFAQSFYQDAYADVIDDQQKTLDKAEKEYDKSVKEGEKLASSIEKNTGNISDAENDITKKTQEIEDLKAEIENLKSEIQQLQRDQESNAKAQETKKKAVEAQKLKVNKLRQVADGLQR